MTPRLPFVLLVPALLVAGVTACGDDDDGGSGSPESTASTSTASTAASASDPTSGPTTADEAETTDPPSSATSGVPSGSAPEAGSAFCEALAEISTFTGEFEPPSPDASFEDAKAAFLEALSGLEDRYEAALEDVPSEVEDDLTKVVGHLRTSIEGLDAATTDDEASAALTEFPEDVQAAAGNVTTYAGEQCGIELPIS